MSEPLPIRSLPTPRSARAGGFTLTELLVVVAIIVLLIGTLFVALGAAAKRAQLAKTTFLMGSIASGLAKFEGDFSGECLRRFLVRHVGVQIEPERVGRL